MKARQGPPWADTINRTRCSTQVIPLLELWATPFLLPAFQRGERWSADMQARLCSAVLVGDPVPPVLLWERRDGTWVIDGQQRLTALGAHVVRPDGSKNAPSRAFFDPRAGRFGATQGRWSLTAVRLARWRAMAIPRPSKGGRDWDWVTAAGDVMRRRTLVTYVLGPAATFDDAVRVFRAINAPGVPMSAGEIETLIASATVDRL